MQRAQTPPHKPSTSTTISDLDMADGRISSQSGSSSSSSFASPRTVLPTSLADFALSPRSCPPSPSSPVMFLDDPGPFSQLRKLRRPSLLGKTGSMTLFAATAAPGSAPHSPLAASAAFGPILMDDVRPALVRRGRGRSKSAVRPKTNSNNHSGSGTPPQMLLDSSRPRSPSTPPSRPGILHRRTHSAGTPFKLPRLLSIQSELANPADSELKSEASFQRLLASNADLPSALVRTPHPRRRDRGRFPEVYLDEDDQPVESDDDDDDIVAGPTASGGSNEALAGPASLRDEFTMDDILDSPARMDVDMGSYGSPPVLGSLFSMKGWRQTPPPTVAPSRIGKRKLDERYEPYPQKRARGISPSSFSNPPQSPITTSAPRPTPTLAPSPPIAIPHPRPG
ncbi:hypothetical protein FRC07_012004, partial [Ceratobasidium sp. 392]